MGQRIATAPTVALATLMSAAAGTVSSVCGFLLLLTLAWAEDADPTRVPLLSACAAGVVVPLVLTVVLWRRLAPRWSWVGVVAFLLGVMLPLLQYGAIG